MSTSVHAKLQKWIERDTDVAMYNVIASNEMYMKTPRLELF